MASYKGFEIKIGGGHNYDVWLLNGGQVQGEIQKADDTGVTIKPANDVVKTLTAEFIKQITYAFQTFDKNKPPAKGW